MSSVGEAGKIIAKPMIERLPPKLRDRSRDHQRPPHDLRPRQRSPSCQQEEEQPRLLHPPENIPSGVQSDRVEHDTGAEWITPRRSKRKQVSTATRSLRSAPAEAAPIDLEIDKQPLHVPLQEPLQ